MSSGFFAIASSARADHVRDYEEANQGGVRVIEATDAQYLYIITFAQNVIICIFPTQCVESHDPVTADLRLAVARQVTQFGTALGPKVATIENCGKITCVQATGILK